MKNLILFRQQITAKVEEAKVLNEKVKTEKRGMTAPELVQYNAIIKEIDSMKRELVLEETGQEQEMRGGGQTFGGTEERGFIPRGYQGQGFRSFGEFIAAVRWPEKRENREMFMGAGASGGFWVPDQFVKTMFAVSGESSIVRPRATVIRSSESPDAAAVIPALDQSGANGAYGGVVVTWIGEGAVKPETDFEIREIKLEPMELAGHIVVTDKLLRNAGESSTFLSKVLREAIFAAEDQACFTGNGIARPMGIVNHPATIPVARAGAGTIGFADFGGMIAALHPDSMSRALWVITQSAMARVVTLTDALGNLIFLGKDATKGMAPTILGIPVQFTGRLPVMGVPGDVVLADFSGYVMKQGSGPFVQASQHPLFTQNKTIVKAFYLVDGQPWLTTPLTLEDGVTQVSYFVQLQ